MIERYLLLALGDKQVGFDLRVTDRWDEGCSLGRRGEGIKFGDSLQPPFGSP